MVADSPKVIMADAVPCYGVASQTAFKMIIQEKGIKFYADNLMFSHRNLRLGYALEGCCLELEDQRHKGLYIFPLTLSSNDSPEFKKCMDSSINCTASSARYTNT